MNAEMLKNIDEFIERNSERMFKDMARLVAVKSTRGEREDGAPFGRGPAEALRTALEMAQALGLETGRCEDVMGWAQIGEGEKYLATICHLDVVPAGDGWTGDPFTLRERDGYLIGRGIMDDKGPAVLSLYALKYVKESGIKLKYPIRALLGTSEETGMEDVKEYLSRCKAPAFCFSPDSNFAVCVGEKGTLGGRIEAKAKADRIVEMRGGMATNVVPGKCEALVKAEKLESRGRVTAERQGELWRLTASGIGGHASLPEGTVNAIGEMVNYLLESGAVRGEEEEFLKALSRLHASFDGSAIGAAADDGFFTPLTIIGGTIEIRDGHLCQSFDCRYPTNTSGEKVREAIENAMGDGARVTIDKDMPPFRMDEKNPGVQTLLAVYNAVTGERAKTYTMGGGTYARHFPNAAAFGPEHPEREQPDFAGPIHGADEAASKAYFTEALKIYILALTELEKLDY